MLAAHGCWKVPNAVVDERAGLKSWQFPSCVPPIPLPSEMTKPQGGSVNGEL